MNGYEYNPLAKLDLQKKQQIEVDSALSDSSTHAVQNKVIKQALDAIDAKTLPDGTNVTKDEFNALQGVSDNIQTQINNIISQIHTVQDVEVTNWTQFLNAITLSQQYALRIHFKNDITVTSDVTLDLSNVMIYGHYYKWIVNAKYVTLTGNYAYFNAVLFQGANAGSSATVLFHLQGQQAKSTKVIFDDCRFFNFLEVGNQALVDVNSAYSGASIHIILHMCQINGSSSSTINNIALFRHSGNNPCMAVEVVGLLFNGKLVESRKLGFSGTKQSEDIFVADGSCDYVGDNYSGSVNNKPDWFYQWGNASSFATAAQGEKAETALQSIEKGKDGNYITTNIGAKTDNKQTISTTLTLQGIATADAQHQGVAEASDVKNYFTTYIPYNPIYGIMWDRENPDPDCVRIGNLDLHATLPVHSQIVGGTLTDAGSFSPFADQSDWTGETRDGSVGQVMSRLPKFYYKFITEGTKCKVLFSADEASGFQVFPMQYISSYKATLQRSTSKLSSVVNLDADYRGGNNNADWDGTYRTLLGKPASNISLTNFRTYARNRNDGDKQWNAMVYMQRKMLYWLYAVEYATRNTQKAYNAALDSNGCRQGGLGLGVTDWNWDSWYAFNGHYPLIPCGYTDEYGNATAQKQYDLIAADGVSIAHTFQVPRYRGIESPFGDIWEWSDGILVSVQANDAGGKSPVYVAADPSKFSSTDFTQYDYVCDEIRSANFIKDIHFGDNGDIICTSTPGASTQYYCDWWYGANLPSSGTSLRGVLFGGFADNGARAGLVDGASNNAPAHVYAYIGSRLCYIPELT